MKTLARERDARELRDRLRRLRPESARRWGRMSPHQMVCHLIDAFHMMMGAKAVSHASGLPQRTILKWLVLYIPLPWPKGVLTRPEIDQALGGRKPIDFTADVMELDTLMTIITSQPRSFEPQCHPIFGQMSEAAWMRWGYLHTDHHFRQFGI
jgi:hypothetical protein